MKQLHTLLLLSVLLISGCTKEDPVSDPLLPLPPSAEGKWVGTAAGILTMTLYVNEDHTVIKGIGTITSLNGGGSSNANISGTNTYPNVSISFGIQGFIPVVITGKFESPAIIAAELNQSGFDQFQLTFYKEE